MEEPRRSDEEHEEAPPSADAGHRIEPEHRESVHRYVQLIEVLEKIPLFRGLTDRQFRELFGICSRRTFEKDEVLFRVGDESWEMFILLRGSLSVALNDGKTLSRVDPVGIIGEMGALTGERRSATIATATPAILLSIHRMELLKLFRHDADLGVRVLLNVILDLSSKLRRDNDLIHELRRMLPPGAGIGNAEGKG